jgi:hypothetical protein
MLEETMLRQIVRPLVDAIAILAREIQDFEVLLEHMRDSTIFALPTFRVPFTTVHGANIAGFGTGENESKYLVLCRTQTDCNVIYGFLESFPELLIVRDAVGE